MEYNSERLVFRIFEEEDFDLFCLVFSNRDVMRYALLDAYASKKEMRPYFETVLRNNQAAEDRRAYEYAAVSHRPGNSSALPISRYSLEMRKAAAGRSGIFYCPPTGDRDMQPRWPASCFVSALNIWICTGYAPGVMRTIPSRKRSCKRSR